MGSTAAAAPLRYGALLLLVGATACASSSRPGGITPTEGDRFYVSGYHPYWAGQAWDDYPFDALHDLFYFEIEAAADGSLSQPHGWPEGWSGLVRRATREGVRVVPTVSMHDADAFVELFGTPASVARLSQEVVDLVGSTPGLGGVHLDFEVFRPVEPEVRDGYTAFVAALVSRIRDMDPSFALSVFTLAFDDDDVYNERALAELADFVVVQGYDFHSLNEARTGPVAALTGWGRLNWGRVVDRFLELGVPPRKIVMAVPLYGYEWPAETDIPGSQTFGPAVPLPITAPPGVLPGMPRAREQAEIYGVRRDAESGSPYYVFGDGVSWFQGWFEDEESLDAKYAFVRERGLGGVALFPLAYGDASLWERLRAAFVRPRP